MLLLLLLLLITYTRPTQHRHSLGGVISPSRLRGGICSESVRFSNWIPVHNLPPLLPQAL